MKESGSKSVLVIAPHPDDESLGCGGTLLRHQCDGDEIHWLIITGMSSSQGFSSEKISVRQAEISEVGRLYGFTSTTELGFTPAQLDILPMGEIISSLSKVVNEIRPDTVYTAYRNDAHTDHQVVFDAVMAATKSFRYPFVREVLAYETISETDFGYKPEDGGFKPNIFVDIATHLPKKLEILDVFESEMGDFPFPRSREAVTALAKVRGVQCGALAAEAFMLIKGIR